MPIPSAYNEDLDLDTNQHGTDGPFHVWEADHTALVHVLWDASRRGLDLRQDADKIASRILGSRWLAGQKSLACKDAWEQGRESIATDMTKAPDETGLRPASVNPYLPAT